MKPEEFTIALAEALVERGVPPEIASAQVKKLFSNMSDSSRYLIESYGSKDSLAPVADALAERINKAIRAKEASKTEADADGAPAEGDGYAEGDAYAGDGYAEGDAYAGDGYADSDAYAGDGYAEDDAYAGDAYAGDGYAEGDAYAGDGYAEGDAYAGDGYAEGDAYAGDGYAEGDAYAGDGYAEGDAYADDGYAEGDAYAGDGYAEGDAYAGDGYAEGDVPPEGEYYDDGADGYYAEGDGYYAPDAEELGVSRALMPDELRRAGIAQDELDDYAPDDATLTQMGLSLDSFDADGTDKRSAKKREILALPPLPEIEETESGRRKFFLTTICLSPVIVVLGLVYFILWGAIFAVEAALIVAFIVALVAVAAGGVLISMGGIIYGVVKLQTQRAEGIFEIGLGIAVAGATLLACVLIYNLALRFMPWAIRKTGRLCRFVTRKIHILILNIRGRFSAK